MCNLHVLSLEWEIILWLWPVYSMIVRLRWGGIVKNGVMWHFEPVTVYGYSDQGKWRSAEMPVGWPIRFHVGHLTNTSRLHNLVIIERRVSFTHREGQHACMIFSDAVHMTENNIACTNSPADNVACVWLKHLSWTGDTLQLGKGPRSSADTPPLVFGYKDNLSSLVYSGKAGILKIIDHVV